MPVAATVITGASGIWGGIPLMWVLMASALAFGGVATGMLRSSEYIERKNPLNKLIYEGTDFRFDLRPAAIPEQLNMFGGQGNRQQRRAAARRSRDAAPRMLSAGEISPHVAPRFLDKAQVGVTVKNSASFPISCMMYEATTEVEGLTPPRATFPRDKTTILPGNKVTFFDDKIEMDGFECGHIFGRMNIVLEYGLPGKEKFDLIFNAKLEIPMEPFGWLPRVQSSWLQASSSGNTLKNSWTFRLLTIVGTS